MKIDFPDVPKILVCVLCGYERHHWIAPELMDFLVGLRYNEKYITFVTKAHNFIPAAGARNFIGEQVKLNSPKPDWVLMIDNDMGPKDNLLDCVANPPSDASIIVPKFHMWDGDMDSTRLCWGMDDEKIAALFDGKGIKIENKYYELTKCGTGAIFIKPDVFDKVPEPWFEYKFNNQGNMTGTEDISFCEKAIAAGLKIYGWGGSDVSHFHTIDMKMLNAHIQKAKFAEISEQKQVAADD